MPACRNHFLSVAEGIYNSESIAEALCKLLECSGHTELGYLRHFLDDYQKDIPNANSNQERENASTALLCLMSGLPVIPVEDVHTQLFGLCKEGHLDRKILYSALIARHELDTLNLFLSLERPYLRNAASISQGLSAAGSNIFMELFLISVSKQQHWLLILMDHLMHLAKQGENEEIQNLLVLPVFQPLWPMFFIEALEKQQYIDVKCLKNFSEFTVKCDECEPSVRELAKKMQWYLDVLLWVQRNTLSSKITSEFHVQHSSTLTVLCQYCNISELPWDKTHAFLEQQCIDGGCAMESEVALFDAFFACTLAFDYVLACLHSRQTKLYHIHYTETNHLKQLQVILCQLQPLSLRLKIVEKIFSLLFLRFEDFYEDICSESEEGEIDTTQSVWNDTGPAANLSCTVLSSSMTSVANTVDFENKEPKTEKKGVQLKSQCPTYNKNDYEPYHQKHGFVVDRFMTRDLLKVLQICLDCCHDMVTHINREEDQNYVPKLHDLVYEEREEMGNRLVSIKNRVVKALWKLEILLGSDFMQQTCVLDAHAEKVSLPSWLFQNYTDDDSTSDEELPHAAAPKRGLRGADVERSSESGSQSNLTNQSQGQHAKSSRKGRRRSSARVSVRGTRDNIIKRMLTSNKSFVSQCLIRGNFEVAKGVVQVLELEKSEIAAEVNFTEVYQKIQQKVKACAEERSRLLNHGSQNSTLKAIQRAASAGVQASSLNKEVENLLLSESLPRILDVEQIPKDYLQLFGGSVEVQPIVSAGVDIVLISSSSLPQAATFWNIVTKFAEELQNTPIVLANRSRPIGFLPLLQNILQVPVTILENMSPSELLHHWDVPNFLTRSLRDSLQFWDTMVKNLPEFKTVNSIPHSDITLFSSLVPLLLLAPSSVSFRGLEGMQESQYLQDFRSYLKSLSGIANVLPSEELSTVLSRSPFKWLTNVILDMGTLPQSIEVAASQLGISLPQILSLEMCSSLPSIPSSMPYLHAASVTNNVGLQVLNTHDIIGPARHPVEAVVSILSSVCAELSHQLCVKQKLLNSEEGYLLASEMSTHQFESILVSSWELRDIDLKLLQPGAETLAFYCNLANLMWIHCLTYLSSIKNDVCLKSLIGGCSLQQLTVLNSVAYQVGSAGILTLWEVQRLALGVHLMRPPGTKALKEYAYVTDSFDPLALFVVSNGSIFSPKLKVVYPDNLEEQLQQSVKDFVQYWAHNNSEQVVIPPLVYQYIQSTGQDMMVFLRDYDIKTVPEYKESNYFGHNLPVIVLEYGKLPPSETFQSGENNVTWRSNSNLCQSVLEYIKGHSPTVYLVLQELLTEPSTCDDVSGSDEEALEATETSITSSIYSPSFHQYPCLDRLCKRLSLSSICPIFNDNVMLCAIHSVVPYKLLWENLNILANEQDWQTIIDVLDALPEVQLKSDPMISSMMDLALLELAVDCRGTTGQPWLFCERINSLCLRTRCVIAESSYWPGNISVAHLKKIAETSKLGSYPVLFEKVQSLLHSIKVYQQVVDSCLLPQWKSWQDVKCASLREPSVVLDQILCNGSAEVCLSWLGLLNVTATHPHLITSKVVVLLLNDAQDRLIDVDGLLKSLPVKRAAQICCNALAALCKLPALQFCVNFLSNKCFEELGVEERDTLEIVTFGMHMMAAVSPEIQIECFPLICNPQLIIEQLVMNMQLEAAEQMLNAVRPNLLKLKSKSPLSIPALDSMLRQYAEKALEFRISQGSAASQLSETSILLASLSSHLDSKESSSMPLAVPSKAEWVPNEQATVCMHCQSSTFTMFNRRHHCRRCGRVVCAQCSPQKMIVESYGNLKVRVCNGCYKTLETNAHISCDLVTNATSDGNVSLPPESVWRLTDCITFNEAVRGEFAYEHAPSVSLCLSILKLHSESAACPNFLVDSCETILSYLQPQGQMPNPEVDYGFVIEMCRSLVVAAKVKCAQWGYISDEPNCDQRLSKIDLLGILVSNGCEALIPNETTTHGFRRLQTQLLEAELWELALEVSTKAGMERIGVWSSWGKGCLRAGRWKEAREKFAHCFPSSGRINKSVPDSPLLLDIIQILESSSYFMDSDLLKKSDAMQPVNSRLGRSPASAVLSSLASLKNISQGKFTLGQGANGTLQLHVYAECCYYLQEYGSHATYLQFLIRHLDFKAAVDHTLLHSVDPQIFFESVYMTCLRRGQIIQIHSAMTAVDSSLAAWTLYLHGICAALERHRLFHTLYEVQQWSKDHVRAAMTCIRFYHLNAKSYSQLVANINQLMRAQSHLEAALAVVCVSKKTPSGQDSSNASLSVEAFESMWLQLPPKELDHHMNTLERQIELTKFLSSYESEGHTLFEAASWFPHAYAEPLALGLPTLFGNTADRKLLAGLCLFCGKNVEEGFGIVYRIMESFNLSHQDIYEAVAVALFRSGRGTNISQLLNCIRSSGVSEPSVVCDSVLMACINTASNQPNVSGVDLLAHYISDQALKIKAYTTCGQLKTAYLLAVKNERLDDIELILQEAERLGQTAIKKICLKRLGR